MKTKFILIQLCIMLHLGVFAQYKVGIDGDFPSLTGNNGLFHFLNSTVVTTDISVLITSNLDEPGLYELNKLNTNPANAKFKIIITPDSSIERIISGNVAGALVKLNGINNLIIDGQLNNDGKKYLRFRNINQSFPVFVFMNNASKNTLSNLIIESCNTSTANLSRGSILFSTSDAIAGNDSNLIANNIICNLTNPVKYPSTAIYSAGTITALNSNNTIRNNQIFNFQNYGIYISTGSGNGWIIENNDFFCTFDASAQQTVIKFDAGNYCSENIIKDNKIGGQAPGCLLNKWKNNSNSSFFAIELDIAEVDTTFIINNVIKNINITSTANTSVFNGISISNGKAIVASNFIGDSLTSNSIIYSGNADFNGIAYTGSSTIIIKDNFISGINADNAGSKALIKGININGGKDIYIESNIIRNIYAGTSSTSLNALSGISLINNVGPVLINGNKIHSLFSTYNSPKTIPLYGIYYKGPAQGSNFISGNMVHSFSSESEGSLQIGIYIVSTSKVDCINNIVRLGIDAFGNSVNKSLIIRGVAVSSSSEVNFFHNSINIAGHCNTANDNTYAFQRQAKGNNKLINNIISNTRTKLSGTGRNYAIVFNNMSNISSDNNIYYAGEMGILLGIGYPPAADYNTLQAVRALMPGNELNSTVANPGFINADANASEFNLDFKDSTVAESSGQYLENINRDVYSKLRNLWTPSDIGAIAIDKKQIDAFTPNLFLSISSDSLQINSFAEVNPVFMLAFNDRGEGVNLTTHPPLLWIRRIYPGYSSWKSYPPSIDLKSGICSFNIYLNSEVDDIYEYYAVAQDNANTPNIWYTAFDTISPVHSNTGLQNIPPSKNICPVFKVVDKTTSVNTLKFFETIKVQYLDGYLCIDNYENKNQMLNVYNLTGQLLLRRNLAKGSYRFTLQSNIYIIELNGLKKMILAY